MKASIVHLGEFRMKRILHRRPSASMVVAMTALVIASTGTALAAGLVNGDKLIKKHSLSGSRLRNHTLTGTQINVSKLGKVPSAVNADHAAGASVATSALNAVNATNATIATNATNATNAATAANVTGVTRFIKTIAPAGTTPATAATVILGTSGPLTVSGYCYVKVGQNAAAAYLSSTAAGYYNSYNAVHSAPLVVGTPVDVSEADATGAPGTADFQNPYDGTFAAITGTLGNYITGLVSTGVNLTSANSCTFAGFTSAS